MELNSLIFPAPSASYTSTLQELLWIPRNFKNEEHKIVTKNFKARIVKASILDENELLALSTNRKYKIIKQFDNVKVQACIYNKESNSEEETHEDKTPITVIKDFNNYNVKASVMEKEKELNFEHNSKTNRDLSDKIPCLWIRHKQSPKIILYFHGNAEDIGISSEFVEIMSKNLKINCLAIEYPGYGIYEGKPSSEQIIIDCESVYDYLTLRLGIRPQNIIVFGRSIGSGPATHLAAHRKVGGLILMSPYTSIRDVAKNIAGSVMQYFVADRFRNIDKMKNISCPVCFLHGMKDKLIPVKHSQDLKQELENFCKAKGNYICHHYGENMTHNDFHFVQDLINPLKDFFKKSKIDVKSKDHEENEFENLPAEVFTPPQSTFKKKSSFFDFIIN